MRTGTTLLALILAAPLVLAGACGGGAEATQVDLQDPTELGVFAARIEREPARADEALAEAGITRDELYQAILDVAERPEAAREYRDAFQAELGA